MSVAEFIEETQEDFKSPTTSTFTRKMSSCRQTIGSLEEVRRVYTLSACMCFLNNSFLIHVMNEKDWAENNLWFGCSFNDRINFIVAWNCITHDNEGKWKEGSVVIIIIKMIITLFLSFSRVLIMIEMVWPRWKKLSRLYIMEEMVRNVWWLWHPIFQHTHTKQYNTQNELFSRHLRTPSSLIIINLRLTSSSPSFHPSSHTPFL